MKKRAGEGKRETDSERDRTWFRDKVAELKTQLEVLPEERQMELAQNLAPKGARDDLSSSMPSTKTPTVLRRRSRPQLIRTAYHEAGHAVAACHFGYTFERVAILPIVEEEWTAAGEVLGMQSRYEPLKQTEENRLTGVQEICIDLAGPVASAMLSGRVDRKRGGTDFTRALGFCRLIYSDESWNEVHALLNTFLAHTISLLSDPRVWSAVETVAEMLVTNYEVSFDQVRQIIVEQSAELHSGCGRSNEDFEQERVRSRKFLRDSIQLFMRLRQGGSD
jgi:hypothetical protein